MSYTVTIYVINNETGEEAFVYHRECEEFMTDVASDGNNTIRVIQLVEMPINSLKKEEIQ